MTSEFTIARILPSMLGVNGSAANAEIVAATLGAMGYAVAVVDIASPRDAPKTADLVCVGSGSGSSLGPAATALIALVPALTTWREQGACFFSVGTGWDLLGRQVTNASGDVIPGAGIYPSIANHLSGRFVGEVAGLDYQGREVAGYINQVGSSALDEGVSWLWTVDAAAAEHPPVEGLHSGPLMATRLGGPALALNPHWGGDIAGAMLHAKGLTPVATDLEHRVVAAAAQARSLIRSRLR